MGHLTTGSPPSVASTISASVTAHLLQALQALFVLLLPSLSPFIPSPVNAHEASGYLSRVSWHDKTAIDRLVGPVAAKLAVMFACKHAVDGFGLLVFSHSQARDTASRRSGCLRPDET